MSRSNKSRKPKKLSDRDRLWYHFSGWILETNRQQRNRVKREVDKALKDPEHEVIVELKGPKGAFDWP